MPTLTNCFKSLVFFVLLILSVSVKGQEGRDTLTKFQDSAKKIINEQSHLLKEQVGKKLIDTNNIIRSKYQDLKSTLDSQRSSIKGLPGKIATSGTIINKENFKKPVFTLPKLSTPLLKFNSGHVDYNFYYRSNIDTPFIEQNVYQHQVNAAAHITIGNAIPLLVNTQIRRSNSFLFRDITDVQVQFDVQAFQKGLYGNVLSGLGQSADLLKDSLTGKLLALKSLEFDKANLAFNSKFTIQQLVEANEILNLPSLSPNNGSTDSLGRKRSDSLREGAHAYIKAYNESKDAIAKIETVSDSLRQVYDKSLAKVKAIKDLAKGKINNYAQFEALKDNSNVKDNELRLIPDKYKWLLGIRKFSLGRTPINYSELTAKNISLNGFNFEYNSWYYASLTAGLVDFRFRDFVINNSARPKQYFYMGRLGIGRLDKNYIIFSVFKGRKQVFASGVINAPYSFYATGASLEAKYQVTKNIYIKGEVAESLAPDFRTVPTKYNKWNLTDKNDKAYAVSTRLNFPKTNTKIEGTYKYNGANYQSFSSFQTNSSFVAYTLKADQYLLKRMFRVSASIKKNEFSNPYLLQTYQSNSVFKSFQLYFRKKKWPVMSVAYMPLSQLTNINGTVYENKFNALNGTVSHFYKVGNVRANTTMMYSKFYNSSADSGFIYFNAQNIFFSHLFQFDLYDASTNITWSTNKNYEYDIIEEVIKFHLKKFITVTGGIKVSNLNQRFSAVGGNCGLQLTAMKNSTISFFYENGYLPGVHGTLVRNIIGSVRVSKQF